MKRLPWLLCLSVLSVSASRAQSQLPWESYLDQLSAVDDAADAADAAGGSPSVGWERAHEVLAELAEHPLDINRATREELERLPFLSAPDIENISAYVWRHGPLKSLGELAMIDGMDYAKRQLLTYFVTIQEEQPATRDHGLAHMLRYSTQDVTATATLPCYERQGDRNGYRGYPYKHSIRYNVHYGDELRAGMVAAQDAGEPFAANKNGLGYDHYSYYMLLRRRGRLKTLALGMYRARFGLGLVMNNDFLLGKAASLATLSRTSAPFRVHASTRAADYLQGVAATVTLARGAEVSAFVSYRPIDATLHGDTARTIVDDGYHRTARELERKNNTRLFTAGGHVQLSRNGFRIGATVVAAALNRMLQPDTTALFRRYAAAGRGFWNGSVDYGYTSGHLALAGETATGGCGALATMHTMTIRVTDAVTLTALQRFYGKRYYGLYARSFSEGGSVQDESGLYGGLSWNPSRQLSVTAYMDVAYFAWPKYQASQASRAWDHLISAVYHTGRWELTARYRLKRREKDDDGGQALRYRTEQRGRVGVCYRQERLLLKTQLDGVGSRFGETSRGWMVTQQARYVWSRGVSAHVSAGYFHTDDYASRVYSYEPGLLYAFSYPVFYGEGVRWTCMVRADIGKRLLVQARLTTTDYFDRQSIGSGYQRVDHSSMTNIEFQCRLKFN